MISLWLTLLQLLSSNEAELKKALQFQYEQKLSGVLKENESLKAEMKRLRSATCPEPANTTPFEKKLGKLESKNEELKVYREALREVQDEKWDDAILSMESFVKQYPRSDLSDNAIYWIAQIYIQKNELGLARAELERLLKLYPQGDRAKKAQARLLSLPGNLGANETSGEN